MQGRTACLQPAKTSHMRAPYLNMLVLHSVKFIRRWLDSEELSEDEDLWAEMKEFWSDVEDMGDGQTARGPARRVRRAGAAAGAGPKRQRGPNGLGPSKLRHQIVTHYNAVTQACCAQTALASGPPQL